MSKITTTVYYSEYEPSSIYICRGVLADVLRLNKELASAPDEQLCINEYPLYTENSVIPTTVYPVYTNDGLQRFESNPVENEAPLFVITQAYENAKPNRKYLVNIYDNVRGYSCRINTNEAERGRLAEGKVYFMDKLWADTAQVGVAEVYITTELDGYGYVMGENIRMEFPTKKDLQAIKDKYPNAYLRRVKSIDPEIMGDICYNSNSNTIIFRARDYFEVRVPEFLLKYCPIDKRIEMRNAIQVSFLINIDTLDDDE